MGLKVLWDYHVGLILFLKGLKVLSCQPLVQVEPKAGMGTAGKVQSLVFARA